MPYLTRLMHLTGISVRAMTTRPPSPPTAPAASPRIDVEEIREVLGRRQSPQVDRSERYPALERPAAIRDRAGPPSARGDLSSTLAAARSGPEIESAAHPSQSSGESSVTPSGPHVPNGFVVAAEASRGGDPASLPQTGGLLAERAVTRAIAEATPRRSALEAPAQDRPRMQPTAGEGDAEALGSASPARWADGALVSALAQPSLHMLSPEQRVLQQVAEVVAWVAAGADADEPSPAAAADRIAPLSEREAAPAGKAPIAEDVSERQPPGPESGDVTVTVGTIELTVEAPVPAVAPPVPAVPAAPPASAEPEPVPSGLGLTRHYLRT